MERIAGGKLDTVTPIELCDVSSGYVACPLLFFLQHARTGVVVQAS